ncbi:methyltransferase domain-containing protein [Streptomyces sp. JJ66]|uniref:class I SAM-dependent methyltransferase n=1 Tax=Streptomyces sp. JJ66 TaxID=2803843 RepID=UPI001C5975E1|nr:methyltransferase domain-containing protein [Streptomyces sp. JJ66]MBW1602033.1 methyltransferase domain-containing protein [Streptomyces sp. JJ66]
MSLLRDDDLAAAFDRAAGAYDRLVAASPGYHGQLRLSARRLGLPDGGRDARVLDLGCGTGASTRALLEAAPLAHLVAVDASPGMLRRARAKRWPQRVRFVHAGAEHLEQAGVRGPFDAVFAAYLVRNLTAPGPVLRRVRALLRPGGTLAVHEYCLSGAARHRLVWNTVCRAVIIPAGSLGPGGPGLYRHLRRSVLDFDTVPRFAARLAQAGFEEVRVQAVPGWQRGIVHTFVARRPVREVPPG